MLLGTNRAAHGANMLQFIVVTISGVSSNLSHNIASFLYIGKIIPHLHLPVFPLAFSLPAFYYNAMQLAVA